MLSIGRGRANLNTRDRHTLPCPTSSELEYPSNSINKGRANGACFKINPPLRPHPIYCSRDVSLRVLQSITIVGMNNPAALTHVTTVIWVLSPDDGAVGPFWATILTCPPSKEYQSHPCQIWYASCHSSQRYLLRYKSTHLVRWYWMQQLERGAGALKVTFRWQLQNDSHHPLVTRAVIPFFTISLLTGAVCVILDS